MNISSLYIHIPFCLRKCQYCDFVSYPVADCGGFREQYPQLLLQELELYREQAELSLLHTIYFGGGTPSLLQPHEIELLLSALPQAEQPEITLEANPETLDEAKLAAFASAGINRLSLGIQSFQPQLLAAMGRGHSPQQAQDMVSAARRAGLSNINIDLIYGLPGQSLEQWQADLAAALALETEHISLYSLTLEPGTPWWQQQQQGTLQPADDDLGAEMLELAIDRLAAAGYQHYEISNFARPGYASRHNLAYWRRENYLGLGVAAAGCLLNYRYYNQRSLEDYRRLLESGQRPLFDEEHLNIDQVMSEAIFLGLRLQEGIDFAAFAEQYGISPLKRFRRQIRKMEAAGLLEVAETGMRLSRRGVLLGNQVFMQFV